MANPAGAVAAGSCCARGTEVSAQTADARAVQGRTFPKTKTNNVRNGFFTRKVGEMISTTVKVKTTVRSASIF
jgi:hypothetical protein